MRLRLLATLIFFATSVFSVHAQVTDEDISRIDPRLLEDGSISITDGQIFIHGDVALDADGNFIPISEFYDRNPNLNGVVTRDPIKEGTLYYDPPTGEMFIDAAWPGSDTFYGYALWSETDRLITDNYTRLGGSPEVFFLQPRGITEAMAFSDGFDNGLYQLGAVYPANVSEEDFLEDVRTEWGNELNYSFNIEFGRPDGIPKNDPDLPKLQDSWASAASLRYIAPTGELILNTDGEDGGFVTIFNIELEQSSSEQISVDAVINPKPGNALRVLPDALAGIGLLEPGEYNLGAVLSAGLSASELESTIASSEFLGAAAVGSSDIDVSSFGSLGDVQMSLVHVPEPAARKSLFVALLLLGMMGRRRNG